MYARDVGFLEAGRLGFENYFNFRGRAQRAEFWWFQLFMVVVSIILTIADAMSFGLSDEGVGALSGIWTLATIIPSPILPLIWTVVAAIVLFGSDEASNSIATMAIILGFLAFFGSAIYILVLTITDSDPHPNRWGPSPKYGHMTDSYETIG